MAEKQYDTFPAAQQQLTLGEKKKPMTPHKGWLVALTIVNVGVLIALFILSGLSSLGPESGIFKSTQANQSAKYRLDITPAGWTFSIWGVIYTWQALWVVYSVVNLFRKTPQGPAYCSPPLITVATFLLYILALGSTIAWLFLFDRDHIEGAFVVLFLTVVFLVSSLALSYRALDAAVSELIEAGRALDIRLVRGLVHNGLGIYGTWTAIAMLLNLAIVITYSDGSEVSIATAGTVALGILTAEIVVFVSTDLLLLDRYSRYTITPYVVIVVALIGSISKNWDPEATNSVFSAVLLALASVALLVKVVVCVYRHVTRPPHHHHVESTLSADGVGKSVP